jgi:hypothetical protein
MNDSAAFFAALGLLGCALVLLALVLDMAEGWLRVEA